MKMLLAIDKANLASYGALACLVLSVVTQLPLLGFAVVTVAGAAWEAYQRKKIGAYDVLNVAALAGGALVVLIAAVAI